MADTTTVRDDLRAAGEELVARAQQLRDALAEVAAGTLALAKEALEDTRDRLAELATDIDALIEDVREGATPGTETPDDTDDDTDDEDTEEGGSPATP
jgi:methyl-accepting chemotaxis protein